MNLWMGRLGQSPSSFHFLSRLGEAMRWEFILQLLVGTGGRGGHFSPYDCYCKESSYCKESRPEAGKVQERACLRVKPKQRGALLRNEEKTKSRRCDPAKLQASAPCRFFGSLGQCMCNSTLPNMFALNQCELILSLKWKESWIS